MCTFHRSKSACIEDVHLAQSAYMYICMFMFVTLTLSFYKVTTVHSPQITGPPGNVNKNGDKAAHKRGHIFPLYTPTHPPPGSTNVTHGLYIM